MSHEQKAHILNSILTIGENVSIDFSGGDPLSTKENIDIVKLANTQLNKDNISVSTTGLSLSHLTDDEIREISNSYELTYDFPIKHAEHDVRDPRYNKLNFEQAIRIKQLGLDLTIFVPVQNLDKDIATQLTSDLATINPDTIAMIRLMPVGNLQASEKKNYDELICYNNLVNGLSENGFTGQVKPTCALRALLGKKRACNMVSEKFGIDHLGNLYSCIWASDIIGNNEKFHFGNLLENPLNDLVKSAKLKSDTINQDKCAVYDFVSKDL